MKRYVRTTLFQTFKRPVRVPANHFSVVYKETELTAQRHIAVVRTNSHRDCRQKFSHSPHAAIQSDKLNAFRKLNKVYYVLWYRLSRRQETSSLPFMLSRSLSGSQEAGIANRVSRNFERIKERLSIALHCFAIKNTEDIAERLGRHRHKYRARHG